ncbi:hypothetical protein HPN41_22625 [Klebsiella pneumoniae]|nr:hypothetical protein [Klebsiella pneumoniae]
MNISTVNELIQSLESAGEPSIREQKFLKLAKAYQQLAAENVALARSTWATKWQRREISAPSVTTQFKKMDCKASDCRSFSGG